MSYDFFSEPSPDILSKLNDEIDELYAEVEALHEETDLLLGLMSGSFAYFMSRLMTAHQAGQSISPEQCEQIVIDALRRVLSTQNRFNYDLICEIQTTFSKIDETHLLLSYLEKAKQTS